MTRRVMYVWLDRTRISRLGRNEQIVLASSHWAGDIVGKCLQMVRCGFKITSRPRTSNESRSKFWYERLMSRMFKRWHAVTMEVLDDFTRHDDEW